MTAYLVGRGRDLVDPIWRWSRWRAERDFASGLADCRLRHLDPARLPDPQREALFAFEDRLWAAHGVSDGPLDRGSAEALVEGAWSRFGAAGRPPDVVPADPDADCHEYDGLAHAIRLGGFSESRPFAHPGVVLHELAHAMAPVHLPAHGPAFAGVALALYCDRYGLDRERVAASAREAGVASLPIRDWPEPRARPARRVGRLAACGGCGQDGAAWEGTAMANWYLEAAPAELVDEIRFAKEMSGETFDGESEAEVRARVEMEVADAQRELLPLLRSDGTLPVFRAMMLSPGAVDALRPGDGLGDCWSHDPRGAHAYDGRPGPGVEPYVAAAEVSGDDVHWPLTIAMLSSGEAEIRLNADASLRLAWIRRGTAGRLGDEARPDLAGEEFTAGRGRASPAGYGQDGKAGGFPPARRTAPRRSM